MYTAGQRIWFVLVTLPNGNLDAAYYEARGGYYVAGDRENVWYADTPRYAALHLISADRVFLGREQAEQFVAANDPKQDPVAVAHFEALRVSA